MDKTLFNNLLIGAFGENGISSLYNEESAEKLNKFYEFLLSENEKYNLTRITEPKDAIYKHFTDSLLVSEHIPQSSFLLDVGSGAGFPSIPLAIFRPDLRIIALDSTAKKISFINSAVEILGLKNVSAKAGRGEELAHDKLYREKFDVVTARAVAAYPVLCEICTPFLKTGGIFLAMKGKYSKEEFEISKFSLHSISCESGGCLGYTLNISGEYEERMLLTLKKNGPTPDKFPRKYATITKDPLK